MITRENYEEYFLLYTDNELPAAERQEVERFVAGQPDLRDEWEALQQCKFSPEAGLAYPGRSALLKPELGESPYTEDLILYIDGELSLADREKVGELLLQQPRAANELAGLRQTISNPDLAIVYPDKDGLLKEEKGTRIIALPWLRVAVAASIAGAVALLLLLPGQSRKDLAASTGPKPASTASPVAATKSAALMKPAATILPTTQTAQVTQTLPTTPSGPATLATPPVLLAANQSSTIHHRNSLPPVTSATTSALYDGTGQRQAKLATINTDPGKTIGQPGPVTTETTVSLLTPGDLAVSSQPAGQTGITKDQSSFATQALQEETNDERNSNFVSDEPAAQAKAKLRGIFRKVTRAFGKTADRDDDGNRQVLVGAFQVSLN